MRWSGWRQASWKQRCASARLSTDFKSPHPTSTPFWPRQGSPEWFVHRRQLRQVEDKEVPVKVAMGYSRLKAPSSPAQQQFDSGSEGGQTDVSSAESAREQESKSEVRHHRIATLSDGARRLASFAMTPRQIKAALDERVIGQTEAKKALAVAFSEHYHHARRCLEEPNRMHRHFHKQNVLLLGPSGSGKSHLVRAVADLAAAPLVKTDATKYSATGYVGRDVGDIVQQLVEASQNDLDVAQFGTVHVDEIDKICDRKNTLTGLSSPGGVNTRDVQQSLLKLMEDFEIPLSSGATAPFRGPGTTNPARFGKATSFSTKHVLFVFSGAFERDDTLPQVGEPLSAADLVHVGLLREFVGRIPVRIALNELSVDELRRILATPSDISPLSRYVESFAAHGIHMTYDDDALALIAKRAHSLQLGARGLLTVVEETLRDFSYHLPSCEVGDRFHLDETTVADPKRALRGLLGLDSSVDLDAL